MRGKGEQEERLKQYIKMSSAFPVAGEIKSCVLRPFDRHCQRHLAYPSAIGRNERGFQHAIGPHAGFQHTRAHAPTGTHIYTPVLLTTAHTISLCLCTHLSKQIGAGRMLRVLTDRVRGWGGVMLYLCLWTRYTVPTNTDTNNEITETCQNLRHKT